jgi:hypothetical protein
MKVVILYIFLSCFIGISAYSQTYHLLPKFYQPLDSTTLAKIKEEEKEKSKKKSILMRRHPQVSSSVSIGTGFSSYGNNTTMMSSYIAPSVSYWAKPKLNFTITGIYMYSNMNGMGEFYGFDPEYSFNSNMSSLGVSGSAYYQVSDRLSIWGDGMYIENESVFKESPSNLYNEDFKTVSIGVGYRITDNLHFNIQYRIMEGYNPAYIYNSPFYYNPRYDPFRSNFGIWDY